MNKNIYRQTDSRWKNLPYPTKAFSFGGNGCGACAVLHCIIELPECSREVIEAKADLRNDDLEV